MVFESAADKADAIIAGEDFERMTKVFIKIRDARAKAKKDFELADAALSEQQKTIRVAMLEKMQANGAKSIGTTHGTVYLDEQLKASAEDWMIVHDFIRENNAFDLLEKRISRNAVKQYMEENEGRLPPGISIFKEVDVKIRRK
jgi:hypothetical protein